MKKRYFMDLSDVGTRLRATREALKLTMEQMRDITGYSKSLISAAENGLKKPSTIYLYAMMDRFGVNINYLFSGKGGMFLASAGDEKGKGDGTFVPAPTTLSSSSADENIQDLFYLMENVDMVRYAVLSFFIQYRTQNKHVIEELLQARREKEKDAVPETP